MSFTTFSTVSLCSPDLCHSIMPICPMSADAGHTPPVTALIVGPSAFCSCGATIRGVLTCRFQGSAMFAAGSGCPGHCKALKLWEAAAKEPGTLDQGAVVRALDHASIDQAPGSPAEMVPGQHHMRHNMPWRRRGTGSSRW